MDISDMRFHTAVLYFRELEADASALLSIAQKYDNKKMKSKKSRQHDFVQIRQQKFKG